MNRFINALKQNIIISQIAQDIDITDDNFKDYVQKLKDVVFDVSVPIYYSPWVNNIESIYISNFNELINSSEVDYSGINGYTKLKTLIITHNNNIKKLNISNLQNLENLIIVDNKNLSEINGLSELRHLNKIIIVGNNIKEVDDINSYAYNTKKSQMNILDVNMYHYFHRKKFDVSNSNINFLAHDIISGKLDMSLFNESDDLTFVSSDDNDLKNCLNDFLITYKDLSIYDLQVLVPMYKGDNGIDALNMYMQGILNEKDNYKNEFLHNGIIYREGDKVLQLVNDVDNNIYNGDVGYIKRITLGSSPLIDIEYTDHVVNYKRGKFEEFTLAYAVSVHKSQGSEYDNVILVMPSNMKRMLYNKLIYTAVTRAKKSLVIIGNLDSFNYSVQTDYSENRKTSLNSFF